jgi:Predicted nucleotide-binding protein containing TIR-like domain
VADPIIDQELVVHVFSPLDGPQADLAGRELRRLWSTCRGQLGMTEPIPGMAAPALLPDTDLARRPDGVAAAQESPDVSRQAVLRRVHDVMNLSVVLAQPTADRLRRPPATPRPGPQDPEGSGRRRLGWVEWTQLWSRASAPGIDTALGEIRLFLARMPVPGAVAATAALGQMVESRLPYQEDRARDWWHRGTTTGDGYAVWDTCPAATSKIREIVVIAGSDRDDDLSAWAWSDGTTDLPPFARYLLHATKLRFEARVLASWGRDQHRGDVDVLLAELSVALAPDAPHPDKAQLLGSRLSRLRAEEARLSALEADLETLGNTVSIARGNLQDAANRSAGETAASEYAVGENANRGAPGTLFAADQALARWLSQQVEDALTYLRIDLGQTRRARELTGEERDQIMRAVPVGPAPPVGVDDTKRRVFVVHGRDTRLARRFFDLLRAVDLRPLEWETLVQATGIATPWLGDVVAGAPRLAQATLALLSPDDVVELHSDLVHERDTTQERGRAGQARPNVLFELGLALMAYPQKTVIVEIGQMRPISDLAGLNVIRFDGSAEAIKKVISRLQIVGCPVDDSGTDWLDPDRFADLRTYLRGPGNHEAPS